VGEDFFLPYPQDAKQQVYSLYWLYDKYTMEQYKESPYTKNLNIVGLVNPL